MTEQLTTAWQTTGRGRSLNSRLLGLLRLSKVFVYQHYYGWALAWVLALAVSGRPRGTTAAMLLFLVGSVAIVACACACDDIVGFRNGSDAINYQAGERLRKIHKKPLLSGAVTELEAIVFAAGAGVVAVAAGAAAFWVLNWHSPAAAYAFYAGGAVFSVQYSAGLKVSYHRGGAETLLCLATASGLLAPYLAVARRWSWPVFAVAILLGLWLVMVSSYSNVNDQKGDSMAGRKTFATTTGPAVFKTIMVLLFLASTGLICAVALATGWPRWMLLTLAPAVSLHACQLYLGLVKERWLTARRIGLLAYDLGFIGLLIPALVMLA